MLLSLIIFVGIFTVVVAGENQKKVTALEAGTIKVNNGSIHKILKDPDYPGYITIKYSGEKAVSLASKKEINLTFELEYVCTDSKTNKHKVTIDPTNKYSLHLCQSLGKGKGTICFNDYVKYDKEGDVVLESKKPVTITMTLTIPEDLPKIEIPFQPLGIVADIPIQNHVGELRLIE